MYANPARPVNTARFVFLDTSAHDFYVDWERVASECVAVLRSEAGGNPYDRGLSDLVGELSTQSEAFRTLWAALDFRHHAAASSNAAASWAAFGPFVSESVAVEKRAAMMVRRSLTSMSSTDGSRLVRYQSWRRRRDPGAAPPVRRPAPRTLP